MIPSWVDELPNAVAQSMCRSDVLRYIGLPTQGSGNHRVVQRWIDKLGLDTSHFDYRRVLSMRQTGKACSTLTMDMVCTKNSTYSGRTVRRLVRHIIPYICSNCNVGDIYNELPLSLQLDHINGQHNDHRLCNLRWLCPNCHSQTATYGSRNRKLKSDSKKSRSIGVKRSIRHKVNWPTDIESLRIRVIEFGYEQVGRTLGVSGAAVKKHLRVRGIVLSKYNKTIT